MPTHNQTSQTQTNPTSHLNPNPNPIFSATHHHPMGKSKKKMSLIPSSWQWPSCKQQPKTHSLRYPGDDIFKTVNSIYNCDDALTVTTVAESASFSTINSDQESVIRGLRSDRLFFEPQGVSNSILEEANKGIRGGVNDDDDDQELPFKESVVLAMESEDPYVDFRRSMEEMVEAHGLKNWACLEELLCWYLRFNGKKNHGFIVGAFVDLLISIAANSTSSTFTTTSSNSSSFSPSLSSLECVEEEESKISCLEI